MQNQPKVFWKSGSNKTENIFLPSTNKPASVDHRREEISTISSSRRNATPLPMPSPNKVFVQRPITPNSPQVEVQRKRKYQSVNALASPKYAPATPVEYEEGRSTPKTILRPSNSQVCFPFFPLNSLPFSDRYLHHYLLRDFGVRIFLTFALQGKCLILRPLK